MNGNYNQKRSFDCEHNNHQAIRSKRSLEDPLIIRKEHNLEKLPPKCLQNILSFATYEKICEMRLVSKVFNETAKRLLDRGHRELETLFEREIQRAQKRVLFSNNVRSSYSTLHFLIGLREAVNTCTIAYSFYREYFVAGKLLDEANCLLLGFNSSTAVPYFLEHAYDQRPHPLLGPMAAYSERAHGQHRDKILGHAINVSFEVGNEQIIQTFLKASALCRRQKMRIVKISLLQKMESENEKSEEFLKLILKLNQSVTQRTNKVNEKETIEIGGFLGAKPPNLAKLPSTCIENIVSRFSSTQMAQLRIVCTSFNEACKNELNREFEKLKLELECKIERIEIIRFDRLLFMHQTAELDINVTKDLLSLLQLCMGIYKWHFGTNCYFIAGKVLDKANRVYNYLSGPCKLIDPLHCNCKSRPHYALFPLTNMVYKAIAHFRFKVVPEYFPLLLNRIYVPDYIISGDVMSYEKDDPLNLEEMKQLVEETKEKIKEQKVKNGKFLKIISGLMKKVIVLNKEI